MKRSLDGPTPATGVDVSPAFPLYHWYEAVPGANAMRYVCDPAAIVALDGWMEKEGGRHGPWKTILIAAMLLAAVLQPFVMVTKYEVGCVSGGVVKLGLFDPTGWLVSSVLVAWYH